MFSPQTSRPLHILVLAPGFPADRGDDTCIPALQVLVRALARQSDIIVSVVAFQYPFRRGTYTWSGATVHACGGGNRGGLARRFLWRQARRAAQAVHAERPVDLIHSFWLEECSAVGQVLARRWNVPQVAAIMGQDGRCDSGPPARIALDSLTLTAPSRRAGDAFAAATGRRIDAEMPIGIDPADLPSRPPEATRDLDLVSLGALTPLKRTGWFLEVVAAVTRERPETRAVVIGDGPERVALEARAVELGIAERVEFTGELSRTAVMARLMRTRVVVHGSRYEAQGYVLWEALASGARVVSTPVGVAEAGPAMAIGNDPAELAEAAQRFLAMPDATAVPAVPSIDATVTALRGVYDRALESR